MRKRLKVIIMAAIIAAVLLAAGQKTFASNTADAVERVDVNRQCSLNVKYIYDQTSFENLDIELYRIANVSDCYEFSLSGVFARYPVSFREMNSYRDWDLLKSTLEEDILSDDIKADWTMITDQSGEVDFSDLDAGVYFIPKVRAEKGKVRCQFESCILVIPMVLEDGTLSYHVAAEPKASETETESDVSTSTDQVPDTSKTTTAATTAKTTTTTTATTTKNPKTGDPSNLYLWLSLCVFSGTSFIYIRAKNKKKRQEDEKRGTR